jgi:hypothetical protein
MKKLLFVAVLCLSGCLNTTNHHPYRDGRSAEQPWWRTPYYADTPRDQNPWLKFVHQKPVDEWSNPWKYDDLRNYGVDVLPGYKAPVVEKKEEPKGSEKKVY